ncbi:DUF4150 domain-containing protein [Pseudomonas sp. B21-028]|uniref:PAAR-like domain-containing protein n=1 Tax=Pseudomonas sp. B21-028 TaxID=2895480 RepID=UPI00215EC9FD|nr:PAAR-like domain-containing protein [Pseudomonas sp. B21-028]UVL86733.1 DUF4150 domain-containing protein [Pseudomonas sp. B21-028]
MGNEVYANNMEVSCKAANGKSVACFPDVCFTPPQTAATPLGVPIPYPNTGMAKDTTRGTRTVKISGKEAMLKDKSYFKTSYGDEAGNAPKKGIITNKIKGKVYFTAWSMNVKFEGENVVRNMDLTTHNHGSTANTLTWPYLDAVAMADPENPCVKSGNVKKVKAACPPPAKSLSRGAIPGPADNTSPECCEARKCMLVPNSPKSRCSKCGGKTPHHPVPVADLSTPRPINPKTGKLKVRGDPFVPTYDHNKAPCICVEGADHNSREGPTDKLMQHGRIGRGYVVKRDAMLNGRDDFTYAEISDLSAQAVADETGCDKDCVKAQIDKGHQDMGVGPESGMRRGEVRAPALEKKPKNPAPLI